MNFFITMILGSILQCLYGIFVTDRISKKEAKKCNYDCSKCGNWRCYYHDCKAKREEKSLWEV